jgi:glutathione peroxidase
MRLLKLSLKAWVAAAGLLLAVPAGAAGTCPALFDRTLPNLFDQPQSLCQYAGKVVLVVNTASQCGFTPQYEGLEKLYRKYKDRGLVVIGFPSNDFGGQEPGSNKDIASFCQLNYGVSFPMFAKTSVAGSQADPLFVQLASSSGSAPRWNFHKYLVNRSGDRVISFNTSVAPDDKRLVGEIEKLLAAR